MYTIPALSALLSLSALGVNGLPITDTDLEARQVQPEFICTTQTCDGNGNPLPPWNGNGNPQPPVSDNRWTVSNIVVGCGNDQFTGQESCSYQFDVEGRETDDLPGFSARCSQRTTPRDGTLRQCELTGGWSATKPNRTVRQIDASLELYPRNMQQSTLTVQLTWDVQDGFNSGTTNRWRGQQTGSYEFFSQRSDSLDLVPFYYQAVAIN